LVKNLRSQIKLKGTTVSIRDGSRSEIRLRPESLHANKKAYKADEYHVGVVFDISEYSQSGFEKLLHAELWVGNDLVDEEGTPFGREKHLEMRGLPIYVFEEKDMQQVVKEEGDEVIEAVEDEAIGIESQKEISADVSTAKSDLEEKVSGLFKE
jgi:hypothetical protein